MKAGMEERQVRRGEEEILVGREFNTIPHKVTGPRKGTVAMRYCCSPSTRDRQLDRAEITFHVFEGSS